MTTDPQEPRTVLIEEIIEMCVRLEKSLTLPAGSVADLPREKSDWAFVIKVAALVEAGVTHLVTADIDGDEIRALVTRLPMQGATGKLPAAKSMGLISSADFEFAVGVSRLRNLLAHDPQFLAFSFANHLRVLDEAKRADFYRWASRGLKRDPDDEKAVFALRVQIWAQALKILTKANETRGVASERRKRDDLYRELVENFSERPMEEEPVDG